MNILIRIENRFDVAQIEESLRTLPVDLYFVRDDKHMLSILEQSSFDAVLVGFSTEQKTIAESVRLLKERAVAGMIPILVCFEDEWGLARSQSIGFSLEDHKADADEQQQLNFELFKNFLEAYYVVETCETSTDHPLVSAK